MNKLFDNIVCRKCGSVHTKEEYFQSKICQECGTFLSPRMEYISKNKKNFHSSKILRPQKQYADFFKTQPSKTKSQSYKNDDEILQESDNLGLVSYSDPRNIRNLIQENHFSSFERFKLNLIAQEIKLNRGFDKLVALDIIRTKINAHPYQMDVAQTVLQDMNSTAILGDEVGLGKTIEAGIIMKELLLRGMINSVLIVVPKSLMEQWKVEMREKFGEDFLIANDSNEMVDFNSDNRIICSSGLFLHRYNIINKRNWDLVIIDEAHKYRNTKRKGRKLLAELSRKNLLLLTATPLCNKITDLYSLIDLVYPGRLRTESSFISRYAADSKCRVVNQNQVEHLKNIVSEVMCRTRRIDTNIPFTNRFVESRRIEAENIEYEFIEKATQYLRDICDNRFKPIEQLKEENPVSTAKRTESLGILIFRAISMQQSLSSSPYAAIEMLEKRYNNYPSEREAISELIKLAKQIEPAKIKLLKKVLKEIKNEQAIIFCLRRATVEKIKNILNEEFGPAEIYWGSTTFREREELLEKFKEGKIKYLVATDAAAEGLNLQNCNVLFNYDLHWNPMKIEQRIGRVHRLGQERDVTIFNLSIKDTIDDYVLHVLYQKINLFTLTIGGMETILAEVQEGTEDIEKAIMEILLRSKDRRNIKEEIKKLSENIAYAQKKQELASQFTKGVLD